MQNSNDLGQKNYRNFVIKPLPNGNIGFNATLYIPNRISITLYAETKKQMRKKIDDVMAQESKTLHIGFYCPKKTEKVLVFSPQKGGFVTELMVMMPGGINDDEFYDVTNITITSKPYKQKGKKKERKEAHHAVHELAQQICVRWKTDRIYM